MRSIWKLPVVDYSLWKRRLKKKLGKEKKFCYLWKGCSFINKIFVKNVVLRKKVALHHGNVFRKRIIRRFMLGYRFNDYVLTKKRFWQIHSKKFKKKKKKGKKKKKKG